MYKFCNQDLKINQYKKSESKKNALGIVLEKAIEKEGTKKVQWALNAISTSNDRRT